MSKSYVVLCFDKQKIQIGSSVSQIVDRHAKIEYVYHSEGEARKTAQLLAEKNPKTPVFIFETVVCFETKAPTFIEKRFNNSGELLPV